MLLAVTLSIAVAIFLVGNLIRVVRTLRAPRPLRWELYPIPKGPRERQRYGGSYFEETDWWSKPAESGGAGELAFMAQEVLLLHSVRKTFRELWLRSRLLHWGLYLYIIAALLVLSSSIFSLVVPARLAAYVFGIGCGFGWLGSVGLLALRSILLRLRPYTTRVTRFNLIFFVTFFMSGGVSLPGLASRLAHGSTLAMAIAGPSPTLTLHLVLLAFFLAYFPFTHMTHAYMKFFTWHGVRWDDTPAAQAPSANQALATNLRRNLTWAAPHVAGRDETTWAQAVADADGRGAGNRA